MPVFNQYAVVYKKLGTVADKVADFCRSAIYGGFIVSGDLFFLNNDGYRALKIAASNGWKSKAISLHKSFQHLTRTTRAAVLNPVRCGSVVDVNCVC